MKVIEKALMIALAGALVLCGCEKTPEPAKTEKKLKLSKTEIEMVIGDKVALKAALVPTVAEMPTVSWTSDNEDVATVNAGTITALAVGKATITATCQGLSASANVTVKEAERPDPKVLDGLTIMFDAHPSSLEKPSDLVLGSGASYTDEGLLVNKTGQRVMLDRFYALAQRLVHYEIKPSANAVVVFHSDQGDFNAVVDVPNKKIYLRSSPKVTEDVPFLEGDKDYIVEISHEYLKSSLSITDPSTGKTAKVTGVQSGCGGCGKGALDVVTSSVGMQWDKYCFVLESGSQFLVKRISVCALKDNVNLIIYGDSITQPEGYFPEADFPRAWTQQIIAGMKGNAVSSGRGGATINELLVWIKNELPFLTTKYVMVTIGTNGGDTEENLSELVDYIKSFGFIPILNNIPSNESGTQIEINSIVEKVRKAKNIKGIKFDLATSINGDGLQVDQSLMYWEDYTGSYGWQVYHHPNEKGGDAMFARSRIDVPEIYE
ncbi:MAG: Ig-like domain-containing protein [Bacteroidales bacterium]|nr:Ig-like domain-containing protein [Bacteroidales bacterium]